jgi:hypothetical protein
MSTSNIGQNDGVVVRLHKDNTFMCNASITQQSNHMPFVSGENLKISSFSITSDRCSPLVVLRTITSNDMVFKIEPLDSSPELNEVEVVHSACLKELKVRSLSFHKH